MLEIKPKYKIEAQIRVPGSKSLTQRALVTSSLAAGESFLAEPLFSEDTELIINGLRSLGADINSEGGGIRVKGTGGVFKQPEQPIYMGNNGTGIRFLTALSALASGPVRLTGSRRMQERPIQDLLEALNGMGVKATSINGTGCPPIEVFSESGQIKGGNIDIRGSVSSQFVSAMLLIAPYARDKMVLQIVDEPVSMPYISMTLKVMKDFGISVESSSNRTFGIPLGAYASRYYQIEGDASNASYFWAAAAVTGGRVRVENIFSDSVQGDIAFLDILEKMGCTLEKGENGVTVSGPETLKGITVDMKECPDIVPTLAVVAAHAEGETLIQNVAHLRVKETDRLHAVAVELQKLGAKVDEGKDSLSVSRGKLHAARIDTYNDHRMAMSFAVAGLITPGVFIENELCVSKSFPNFWDKFNELYD